MNPRRAPRLPIVPEALAVLGVAAAGAEILLGLVGGLPAVASGAVLLAVAALLGARYVNGAEAMDGNYRRAVRLVGSREPTLRYWDAAIEDARESLSGYELHLRPLLQRLYSVRLADRHGVSMETQPERAAALIGPELWPWIDPSRPRLSQDALGRPLSRDPKLGPAVPDPLINALVDRLEQL